MHKLSEASSVSVFRQKTTYLVGPLHWAILSHGNHRHSKLVKIRTWEHN